MEALPRIADLLRIGSGLAPAVLIMACNDPVKPRDFDRQIQWYSISGQAFGTDAATGEELTCVFYILRLDTGGPLIGSWTDTTTITVIRARKAPTQQVTYDTTIAAQEVTLTVPDSFHIQLRVAGPFTEDLTADMTPAYPGAGASEWTCGAAHPLSRVQPDAVLTGSWTTQPFIDIPIG
jgi:hypothetical protein